MLSPTEAIGSFSVGTIVISNAIRKQWTFAGATTATSLTLSLSSHTYCQALIRELLNKVFIRFNVSS